MNGSPTVRDLLREAGGPLPTLLAVTILVQVLGVLVRLRERGRTLDHLAPDDLLITGAPPRSLLAEPSRDPRIRIAAEPRGGTRPVTADAGTADALFRELTAGTRDRRATRLLRRLERGASQRLDLDQALDKARTLGLELLAERIQVQEPDADSTVVLDEDCVRQRLGAALYSGRWREVERCRRQLSRFLGDRAAGDGDLAIALGWLAEQAVLRARRQDEARKTSLKLVLTGAPLVFATFLTSLLGVVLLFSA